MEHNISINAIDHLRQIGQETHSRPVSAEPLELAVFLIHRLFDGDFCQLAGGIGLQLAVGYTVSYLVYTIGTLIVDASALNIPIALAGLAAVLVMVGIIVALIIKTDKKIKAEYELKKVQKAAVK